MKLKYVILIDINTESINTTDINNYELMKIEKNI